MAEKLSSAKQSRNANGVERATTRERNVMSQSGRRGPRRSKSKKDEAKSDPAVSYNDFKEFEGQRYTGMKIGRTHKWRYDAGEWREKKITPDLWQISYAVTKRRAGRAPEGSGVPVSTGYHWYIVAHQNTTKQTANDYTTSMTGLKFKIAHKRAGSEKWSATPRTQRKRMIAFLQSVIADLEKQNVLLGDAISAPEKSAASEGRKGRTPSATMKRAVRRRHRVSRVSPRHPVRRMRARRAQHSRS